TQQLDRHWPGVAEPEQQLGGRGAAAGETGGGGGGVGWGIRGEEMRWVEKELRKRGERKGEEKRGKRCGRCSK
ncbi:hypothetical protein DVA76_19440, partial [Acinetobacter baumannii]